MTPIAPIEAYATSDGRLFQHKYEAEAHQYGIDITPEVNAHVKGEQLCVDAWQDKRIILCWEVTRKLKELKGYAV